MTEQKIVKTDSLGAIQLAKGQKDYQFSQQLDSGNIGPLDPPYSYAAIDDTGNEGRIVKVKGGASFNKANGGLTSFLHSVEKNPGDSVYAERTVFNYFGFGISNENEQRRGLFVEAVFKLDQCRINDDVKPEHPVGTWVYFNDYTSYRIEILRQFDIGFWVSVGDYDHLVLQAFHNKRNGPHFRFERTKSDTLRMQYKWNAGEWKIGESELILFKVGVVSRLYVHSDDCEFITHNSYDGHIEQVSASFIT